MAAQLLSPLEVGRHLQHLRERAGLKQADLARKVTWSPSALSRVEAGERELAPDELDALLKAIGTPEASGFAESIERDFKVLGRPPFDHPDHDLLWEAEQVAGELLQRRDNPSTRNAFERRLSALLEEIKGAALALLKREHQVAFVGSIGIGKSTAICRMTGLEVPGEDGAPPASVLEAGAGGVTICDVHLRRGPGYGIIVEPRSEAQVRAEVGDFADFLLGGSLGDDDERGEDAERCISREIERAIRNMSRLTPRRDKTPDGKTIRTDPARELGKTVSSARELVVEILSRMELHRRDRRDVWYDVSSGKLALVWLKDTFELINNGRHPEFTLPQRIEVVVPDVPLGVTDLEVRIVDTRGIDDTAARADIESHLDDSHTIVVLCSAFNDAPSAHPRTVLKRAADAGVRGLTTRSAVLVLPRADEALAVKDEGGMRVVSHEDGYELKAEQIAMSLQPLRLQEVPSGFYNAFQDGPERLRQFLIQRLAAVRADMQHHLRVILRNASSILANYEREQTLEVQRHAESMLRSWIAGHNQPGALSAHVQDSLMGELRTSHHATIRASVRRDGEWHNLSYSHHLGYGARRLAVLSLESHVAAFTDLCQTMRGNPEYAEAQDLLAQGERVMAAAYDELLKKLQLMGQTAFGAALKQDLLFWVECNSEWGAGPGYKDRVAGRNTVWFSATERQDLEKELLSLVAKEWQETLRRVTDLFEPE